MFLGRMECLNIYVFKLVRIDSNKTYHGFQPLSKLVFFLLFYILLQTI